MSVRTAKAESTIKGYEKESRCELLRRTVMPMIPEVDEERKDEVLRPALNTAAKTRRPVGLTPMKTRRPRAAEPQTPTTPGV